MTGRGLSDLFGEMRVEHTRLDVANVQMTRGLGGEPSDHLAVLSSGERNVHRAGIFGHTKEVLRQADHCRTCLEHI